MEFSEWIKEQLANRDWTQYELAQRTGISEGHINHVMHGNRKAGHKFFVKLSQAFEVDLAVVMQAAGMLELPATEDKAHIDKRLKEINVQYNHLDERDKEEIYNLVGIKYRRRQRKKKQEG